MIYKNYHDIVEHSICQPGLPNPQGEDQYGSPTKNIYWKNIIFLNTFGSFP